MKIISNPITLSAERESLVAKLVEDYGWYDGFALLDGSRPEKGKVTFVLLEPALRVWGDLLGSHIEFAGGEKLRFEEPLEALKSELISSLWHHTEINDLPVLSGYISYELAHLLESIPYPSSDRLRLPLYAFCAYRKILEVPHDPSHECILHEIESEWSKSVLWQADREKFVSHPASETRALVASVIQDAKNPTLNSIASCQVYSNFSETEYRAAVAQAQEWIKAGEVYQVNFTQRFELPYEGSSELYYLILRAINPAAYSAYLKFSGFPGMRGFSVCSISPELFMSSDGAEITVSPIKGTIKRGANPGEDLFLMEKLKNSEKDRAELCMIVDLMRNDLSRIAESGSVRVKAHARLETHPTLHHLVSDVQCKRRQEVSFLEVVRAMFPCGSITGAPKIAAMKCISHLERTTRGVYCGAIGYLGLGGAFKFNVAIRTVLHRDKKLYASAGGGIVSDSVPTEEYQESLIKAISMLTGWRLAQQISQEQKEAQDTLSVGNLF